MGQNTTFRYFQAWETGREMIKSAPNGGLFDADSAPAEPVVVPVAPLEGAVDEEPQDACCLPVRASRTQTGVLLRWFIGIH